MSPFAALIRYAGVFGYFPVVRAGVWDGVSPGLFTALIVFAVFMMVFPRAVSLWGLSGWSFMTGLLMTRCFFIIGGLDPLLQDSFWTKMLAGVNLGMAFLALGLGGIFLRDWRVWRKTGDPQRLAVRIPGIRANGAPRRYPLSGWRAWVQAWVGVIKSAVVLVAAFLAGCFSVVVGSVWPQDAAAGFILYQFLMPGQAGPAFFLLLLYGIFFIWPVAVLWILGGRLCRAKSLEHRLDNMLPKLQISCSAICFGYAIGVINHYF